MQVHMVVPDRFLDVEEFPTALGGKEVKGTNRLQDKVVVKSFRFLVEVVQCVVVKLFGHASCVRIFGEESDLDR